MERFGWWEMPPPGHVAPGVAQQLLRHLGTVRKGHEFLLRGPVDDRFEELFTPRPECIWLLRMLRPVYP